MQLATEARRKAILERLLSSREPISAKVFAIDYHVSRQVIVYDIAVLRASRGDIISTNRGYFISTPRTYSREFKVMHHDDQVEQELTIIVDYGGKVRNVSISHRIYGRITAELNICSRADVRVFLEKIGDSSSKLLGSATMGYHYHLVEAESSETLDLIEKALYDAGLLAPYLNWEKEDTCPPDGI